MPLQSPKGDCVSLAQGPGPLLSGGGRKEQRTLPEVTRAARLEERPRRPPLQEPGLQLDELAHHREVKGEHLRDLLEKKPGGS